jgi:hypothetical protein
MKDMSGTDYDAPYDMRSYRVKPQGAALGLRFAHGATFQLKSDSLADYLLAPIFLKFLALSAAIVVLLHDRPVSTQDLGMTSIVQWVAVTGGTLACLFCFGAVCVSLKNVGAIRTVYTPMVCLPSIVLTEYAAQELLFALWGVPRTPMETSLIQISRMCGAVILLDILYGSFVAGQHPQTLHPTPASMIKSQTSGRGNPQVDLVPDAPVPEAEMTPPTPPEAEVDAPRTQTRSAPKIRIRENIRPAALMRPSLTIGTERVPLETLILIGAEDHYLRVVTLQGNQMIRGKLATVVEKLDPDLGVQVNRSVWVARAQISYAQIEDSRKMCLFLGNGQEVTVARPRLTLVKECLRRWDIDLRDSTVSGTGENDLDRAS